MSVLAGVAYALLAVDFLGRASGERRPGADRPQRAPLGDLFSDPARALALSPALRRGPARATIYRDVPGLAGRVNRIRRLIRGGSLDPAVRRQAGEILAARRPDGRWAVAEKDWRGEAEALFGWTRRNVRYTRDPVLADTYVHPARTLFDRPRGAGAIADCDDYSITLGAMLMAVGHSVRLRVAAIRNPGDDAPEFNHIWLVDRLPAGGAIAGAAGPEIPLDPSVDRPPGWEAPRNRITKVRDFEV